MALTPKRIPSRHAVKSTWPNVNWSQLKSGATSEPEAPHALIIDFLAFIGMAFVAKSNRLRQLIRNRTITTAELLRQRLELVFRWYRKMVNADTGMLEYLYLPQENNFIQEKCPIRNIGSLWDVELLSAFLGYSELRAVVETSLHRYVDYLIEHDGCLILDTHRLEEPSTIAHSAFMLLALASAARPPRTPQIRGLADGILKQQRPDGSYKVCFHALPDEGEELYAGEAMLALLEAYRRLRESRYLQSAQRGLSYYDAGYLRRGRVTDDVFVFFANWQSQVGRLLFESTANTVMKQQIAEYMFRMHDCIIERGFYANVERHPDQQASVEVACALEGLSDTYAIAWASNDDRAAHYRQCTCAGLTYLLRLQCTASGTQRERGGFGLSLHDRTQRIDITGHAASAFMKCMASGIECEQLVERYNRSCQEGDNDHKQEKQPEGSHLGVKVDSS